MYRPFDAHIWVPRVARLESDMLLLRFSRPGLLAFKCLTRNGLPRVNYSSLPLKIDMGVNFFCFRMYLSGSGWQRFRRVCAPEFLLLCSTAVALSTYESILRELIWRD
jgi:hypothetical protein